jgi:hypothetical protein
VLDEEIMQVVLEEAHVSHQVLNVNVARDRGEVVVTLMNEFAAHMCVFHFHGRSWGGKGLVKAMIVPPRSHKQKTTVKLEEEPVKVKLEELNSARGLLAAAAASTKALSAAAPEFVPFSFQASGSES